MSRVPSGLPANTTTPPNRPASAISSNARRSGSAAFVNSAGDRGIST